MQRPTRIFDILDSQVIENPIEKAILEKYLPNIMSESNYRRQIAVIQNTL
jgi:hypothetical protein